MYVIKVEVTPFDNLQLKTIRLAHSELSLLRLNNDSSSLKKASHDGNSVLDVRSQLAYI